MSNSISVILAEDQSMLREALATLLSLESDIEVLSTASNGQEALSLIENMQPNLLITDIEMPEMSGLELAEKVHNSHPSCKIIILTTFARSGYLKRAMAAGADGYLLKDAPIEELYKSIKLVMQGQKAISPELAIESWSSEPDPLSDKERKALKLAAEGKSTADIAKALFLSEGTIRNYLSEAISKLNASNRIEAARIAKNKGWL